MRRIGSPWVLPVGTFAAALILAQFGTSRTLVSARAVQAGTGPCHRGHYTPSRESTVCVLDGTRAFGMTVPLDPGNFSELEGTYPGTTVPVFWGVRKR